MQNKIKFISKEAADIFMVLTKLLTKHVNGQHIIKRPSFGTIYATMNM